ncbi:MAG: ATP-binding protein [Polyangiaceae bacterium]
MDPYQSELARHVLEELPMGVWVAKAPSGQVIYSNRRFTEILGGPADAASEIHDAPATYGIFDRHGQAYPVEGLPFSRALREGKPVVVEDLVIHRADGARVPVRAFANPIHGESGAIDHVFIAFTDISQERLDEERRVQLEARLAFAIGRAQMIFGVLGPDGTILAAEGAPLRALGLEPSSVLGKHVLEIYPENPAGVALVKRALAGEPTRGTLDIGPFTFDLSIEPLRDASGKITSFTVLATDVTEQRALQARLVRDDRIRAMGTLAASVAHEVNNPLTYVLAHLERIRREVARATASELSAETARTTLKRIGDMLPPVEEGAERVRRVARDLLTFARSDDDKSVPVDVRSVVESVVQLVGKEILARARFVMTLGETPLVRANEVRLAQVITNLLVNAWQALDRADPTSHEVGLATSTSNDVVIIDVWDTGPGVPENAREAIFEPFVSSKQVGEGTGLGLFVSRNIVRALGGTIEVLDRAGGGALFRVKLPALGPNDKSRPPSSKKLVPSPRGQRLLIIDDDALVGGALRDALDHAGYAVDVVTDGRAALSLLETTSYALVYCDLMMSGMSGVKLAEVVFRTMPAMIERIVFMTGGAFTPEAIAFVEQHRQNVVIKPFDVEEETRRRLKRLL